MQRSTKRIVVTAVAVVVSQIAIYAPSARAATRTWDGGGTDDTVANAVNWVGDTLPATADGTVFAGSVRTTPTTSAGPVQYLSLFFGAGAAPFDIGGANAITLGSTTAGNYIENDTVGVAQTIDAPINMIGGSVNAAQGNLVLNGPFNLGNGANATGNNVTFTGGNNITLGGTITGTGTAASAGAQLLKTGSGTLFITGDSPAWAGKVTISGGALRLSTADGLGTGGGTITVAGTSGSTGVGALELTGGITLAKTVNTGARNSTTQNNVHIRNVSGNNTINTVVTGTGGIQYNYESAGGYLTIGKWDTATTPTTGPRTLRLLGAADGEIDTWSSAASTNVTLIKDGAGTWTLRSGMNPGVGGTSFVQVNANAGTLVLDGGLGALVTGNTTIASGATLKNVASNGVDGEVGNGTPATTLTINSGGTLDAATFTQYNLQAGQTLVAGGTIKAGNLGAFGDNAIYIGNTTTAAAGTLTIVGNLSLTNQYAAGAGGLHFDLANTTTPGASVNDLISVQGDLQVDGSSGPINVYINPLSGNGFTTGTYRLIDFTGPSIPSSSDFAVTVGGGGSQTRQSFAIATAADQVNLVVNGAPGNLVWKGDGGANSWDVVSTKNWTNGASPDFFYQFDNVTLNDSTANTTLNVGAALQTGSLAANTTQTYTIAGGGSLTVGGNLTKDGAGILAFANAGPNTFSGAVTVNAGTLQLGDGVATNAVTNNGTLVVNNANSTTITQGIAGSGALVKRGTGSLTLGAAGTYTGATTVEAGTVALADPGALGDSAAGTTVNSGGTVQFATSAGATVNEPFTIAGDGATAGNGALRASGAVVTILAAPVTLAASATVTADAGATLNFANTVTGSGTLTKAGSGTVLLAAPGSGWTGGTVVNAGTLQLGAGTTAVDLPAGPVTVAAAGNLLFGSSQNITFTRTVTGAGTLTQSSAGGSTTLTGDLTGFTGMISTGTAGVLSTLVVATPTAASTLRVFDSDGVNTQNGLGFGVLRITNSSALAPSGLIQVQVAQNSGTGRVELGNNVSVSAANIYLAQRNNTTAAILSTDGNNTLSGAITLASGGSQAALESAAGATFTVNGTITANANAPSARAVAFQGAGNGTVNAVISNAAVAVNVLKAGAGTWTLAGNNTYTGTTTVSGGRLVVTQAASGPILSGAGGAIVNGGQLILDYTGGTSPIDAVKTALTNSYAASPHFSSGQIRSTAADANHALGYYDDGASQVTVMFTYYGDLNLDGVVNADDYALLDRGFAMHLTGWVNGDVNYSGTVDSADYLLIDTTYAQQGNPLSPAFLAEREAEFGSEYVASLVAAVPEPASLGLTGVVAAVGLFSRRRRK